MKKSTVRRLEYRLEKMKKGLEMKLEKNLRWKINDMEEDFKENEEYRRTVKCRAE